MGFERLLCLPPTIVLQSPIQLDATLLCLNRVEHFGDYLDAAGGEKRSTGKDEDR